LLLLRRLKEWASEKETSLYAYLYSHALAVLQTFYKEIFPKNAFFAKKA